MSSGSRALFFPSSSFVKPHPKIWSSMSTISTSSTITYCSQTLSPKTTEEEACAKTGMKKVFIPKHVDNAPPVYLSQKTEEEEYEKAGVRKELIPKHIAIILDGNRRWLKERGEPLNYVPFFQSNALFADLCLKWGVSTATTFIYSYDNLQRGKVCTLSSLISFCFSFYRNLNYTLRYTMFIVHSVNIYTAQSRMHPMNM